MHCHLVEIERRGGPFNSKLAELLFCFSNSERWDICSRHPAVFYPFQNKHQIHRHIQILNMCAFKKEPKYCGSCKMSYANKSRTGREPWSSGYGKRLTFRRSWVRIPAPYTGWTFFTYICCKNCNVCLKRLKINEKEAGIGPLLKK